MLMATLNGPLLDERRLALFPELILVDDAGNPILDDAGMLILVP